MRSTQTVRHPLLWLVGKAVFSLGPAVAAMQVVGPVLRLIDRARRTPRPQPDADVA